MSGSCLMAHMCCMERSKDMRVYISGKITGTTDYMKRFEVAERGITAAGDVAVNPARINAYLPEGTTHEQYMEASVRLLKTCDCMYVLRDWYGSKGVMEELSSARMFGIPTYFEELENLENVVAGAMKHIMKSSDYDMKVRIAVNEAREVLDILYLKYKAYAETGLRPEELGAVDEEYCRLSRRVHKDEQLLLKIGEIVNNGKVTA